MTDTDTSALLALLRAMAAYNDKGFEWSKHSPALPLYDSEDTERALKLFATRPFGTAFEMPDGGPTVTLRRAGHILGASTVDVFWHGRRVVFTGDLEWAE